MSNVCEKYGNIWTAILEGSRELAEIARGGGDHDQIDELVSDIDEAVESGPSLFEALQIAVCLAHEEHPDKDWATRLGQIHDEVKAGLTE